MTTSKSSEVFVRLKKGGYFGNIPKVEVKFEDVPVKGTAGNLQRFDRLVKIYRDGEFSEEFYDNSSSSNWEIEELMVHVEKIKHMNNHQEMVYEFLTSSGGTFADGVYPHYDKQVQADCCGLMTADEFRQITHQKYGVIPTLYEWWDRVELDKCFARLDVSRL